MPYSLLVPRDTAFDRGLATIRLTRRDIRNVFLEFIGTMLFTIWGSSASATGGPWANGLALAAAIYLTDGGEYLLNLFFRGTFAFIFEFTRSDFVCGHGEQDISIHV